MSSIVGYRMLLIPCKHARRLSRDPHMVLHFLHRTSTSRLLLYLNPCGHTCIQDKMSFLHFVLLNLHYVELKEIPPFPCGISYRATGEISAQHTARPLSQMTSSNEQQVPSNKGLS